MAVSTQGIVLKHGAIAASGTQAYGTTLTDLQEVPELPAKVSPERLEITTLNSTHKEYMDGLSDIAQELQFKFLYNPAQFGALSQLSAAQAWQVCLPDGAAGSIGTTASFTGKAFVMLDSGAVNAPLTYTLTIAVDSEIVFAA